eukprot:g2953.t1
MSSAVVWAITRKQNSFLRKQRHSGTCTFSADPYNLTNENKISASGLCHGDAVSVATTDSGSIALRLKARKRANKPSDLVEKEVALAEDGKTAGKAAIEATTSFRRDQQRAALARYTALSKAAKVEPEELTGRDRSWKRRKTSA